MVNFSMSVGHHGLIATYRNVYFYGFHSPMRYPEVFQSFKSNPHPQHPLPIYIYLAYL